MYEQKVKVTNLTDDSSVFFFDHSFKTAREHADAYIGRNKRNTLTLDYVALKMDYATVEFDGVEYYIR